MSAEFFSTFIKALENSEAGRSLKETYRWSQFRKNESNEEWKAIYGATGQVFSHGILFYNFMRWFTRQEKERFNIEEVETLLWGTAPHDIGEAKINGKGVGDIGAYAKTSADEKKETKIAYRAIDSLDLSDEIKSRLLDGYKKVIEGEDPKLHQAFKALEKTEYVLTAIKVYLNGKRLKFQGKPGLKFQEPMIGRVLVFDLPKVLEVYAPEYPASIGKFFHDNSSLIDEMFAYSLHWLMENKFWDGKDVNHSAKAEEFRVKWEAFNAQNST